MDRRTLTAALQTSSLTTEALDFVKAGTPSPSCQTNLGCAREPQEVAKPSRADSDLKSQPDITDDSDADIAVGLVSLTVRVPRNVPPELLLASMERKLKRQRPWTQQEIVAEALSVWLKRHGYLSRAQGREQGGPEQPGDRKTRCAFGGND